jgi:hypothetical protein
MSHYFDDVLHRQVGGAQTPKSPAVLSPNMPRLRRSSTNRSIAARSDYSVNGHDEEDDDDGSMTPGAGGHARRGSVNPAILNDPERMKERAEADAHLHSYISQQLERVKQERGVEEWEGADEIEAQP